MTETRTRPLVHLPNSAELLRPLIDLDVKAASDVFHPAFATPEKCGTCLGAKTFSFYGYASVEWQRVSDLGRDPNPHQVREYECDCRAQWLAHRCLAGAGVTTSYQRMSKWDLTSDYPSRVYTKFLNEIDSNLALGFGMVLVGSYGLGKTLMSNLLVKDVLRRGKTAYSATFARLINLYEQTWHDENMAWWWNRRVRNAALVVVDDIGKETKSRNKEATNLTRGLLDDLIRYRVGANLSTIVTTNIVPDLFGDAYGENLNSLFGESCEVISLRGDDARPRRRDSLMTEHRAGLTRPILI